MFEEILTNHIYLEFVAIVAILGTVATLIKNYDQIKNFFNRIVTKMQYKNKQLTEIKEFIHGMHDMLTTIIDITKSQQDQINTLDKDQKLLMKSVDENEMDRIRHDVLDFAGEIMNGKKHTKHDYEYHIKLGNKYQELLDKRESENGVFETEYDFIKEKYKENLKSNDFAK